MSEQEMRPASFNDRIINNMVMDHWKTAPFGESSVAVVAEKLKCSCDYVCQAVLRARNAPPKKKRESKRSRERRIWERWGQ